MPAVRAGRVFFQFTAWCPTETDGNLNLQFATDGFLKDRFCRPLPKQIQLEFTDCALHAQE